MEECLSFSEVQNKYFEIQPKAFEVMYALAAAFCVLTEKYLPKQAVHSLYLRVISWRSAHTKRGRRQSLQTCQNDRRPTHLESCPTKTEPF